MSKGWCLCFDCIQEFLFFATPPLRDFWLVFALFRFARTDRPVYRPTDQRPHDRPTDRPTASCTRCSRLRSRSLITAAGRPIAQVAIPVIQSLDISPSPSGRLISSYIPKQTRKSRKRTRYHSAPFPPSPSPTPSGRHVNLNWVRCIWIFGSLGVWRLCVCAIEAVSHTLVLGPVVLDSDALVLGDVDGRMVDGWTAGR